MADPRELEHRKQLLLARSTLHRLQVQHQALALRRSLSPRRTVASLAASAPFRSLAFGALLMVTGERRLGRLLRGAMAALAIAKALRAAWALRARG